jgi:F0F1-type ATP synthase membrane subunit b/b'
MGRKIFTWFLIVVSSIMLMLSAVGIGLAWFYNEPLTGEAVLRLQEVDAGLAQIQTDLKSARAEVERALRIIESAEKALQSLTEQTQDASQLLEQVNNMLDDRLIPGLGTTRERISQLRGTLVDLREALEQVNTIPFVDLNIPGDDVLADLIAEVDSLDSEIANVEDLAQKASTFVSDTSYLLGGDFNETKQNLQELLQTLKDYDEKITGWRTQVKTLIESAPRWIDNASIIITLFLLWFGFSQFGLLLHGLHLRQGGDPLAVLRRQVE